MRSQSIPSPVVWRLSLYVRQLEHLAERGVEKISSRQLAETLQITDAQVRKDLAYFGQFGRPGVGYSVGELIEQLRRILQTDRVWKVIIVGVGDLGRALLRHKGFLRKSFEVVSAFDISRRLIGSNVGGVTVRHMKGLSRFVKRSGVKLAVVAVPSAAAQEVADRLCEAGIQGILNFAPTSLQTPESVTVRQVDLAAQLEQLSFHVGSREG
jgi:redox-sensing transcriptional repressor